MRHTLAMFPLGARGVFDVRYCDTFSKERLHQGAHQLGGEGTTAVSIRHELAALPRRLPDES